MTEAGQLTPVAQSKGRASQLVGAMGSTPEILGEVGFFFETLDKSDHRVSLDFFGKRIKFIESCSWA